MKQKQDEAKRERYLYWYAEHAGTDTVDFIQRCIRYYGYKTKKSDRQWTGIHI